MNAYLFPPAPQPTLAVKGEEAAYPVRRIFCVGRNYAAHAAEMGVAVDREAPFYFTKSPHAVMESGGAMPYPPGTENFHFEMELVVALGGPAFRVSADQAMSAVYAFGCGLDMTRRDLQLKAREKQRPWDLGKDFEQSAVLAPMTRAAEVAALGSQRIWLTVNGETKQDAHLSDLIHSVPEIIADLSKFYHLDAGDIIMTGTPAGVGPVQPGDVIEGGIDGLENVSLSIGEPA
ncbi:MAG: fumarylacetoacetate hydrolase family protein [Pararhodobacter sp.]|nr:fumarylacetoacetate hydrolase family protein [Pararhodobacter sp.]